MKTSRAATHSQARRLPRVQYDEREQLTSYSGLLLFGSILSSLKAALRALGSMRRQEVFGLPKIVLLLVVHILLGFRRLRGLEYYRKDPLVGRLLGLKRVPSVATVSRALRDVDATHVDTARRLLRGRVIHGLRRVSLSSVTLDFDGSVQLTSGLIEGTAVGFNKVKSGSRAYYPLFATVSETGQFLDLLHRPGNAHDSTGATWFMLNCLSDLRKGLPAETQFRSRFDSAFFEQRRLEVLDENRVEFTCSVPFERMPKLKALVEAETNWQAADDRWSFAEANFLPTTWKHGCRFRFLLVRCKTHKKRKSVVPLQLDLFEPVSPDFRYKVIVTNRRDAAKDILLFHNGRGMQERLFGEAKQSAAMGVIATKKQLSNELFTIAGMMAHNAARELQMKSKEPTPPDAKAGPLWRFAELGTLQLRHLHVAGRLTNPAREPTLTVNAQGQRRLEFERLRAAA